MMITLLLKRCDRIIGGLFTSLLTRPHSVADTVCLQPSSILIIRPGGIGDAVLLIPAIQAINKKYPTAKITVLAERRNASAFQFCREVNHVLRYDLLYELFSSLSGDYDVVIDSEQWHRLSAVVARLTRAPLLIGFGTNKRARLFTHQIAYSHDDYESDSFYRLLAPLGIGPACLPAKFLAVPAEAERRGASLLADLGNRPFVSVFPGASIRERRWGADKFRRLAELLSVFGVTVVVVGGRDDIGQGETIVSGGLGLNLAGRTTLAETAAIIEKSALLVSGDSGVLHIAIGLGKPTVSLFGPGRARKWAPRGERHVVINKGLPCSPCTTYGTTPPCPSNARCMADISADEVFNAAMMLLTAEKAISSACCKKDWIEVSG